MCEKETKDKMSEKEAKKEPDEQITGLLFSNPRSLSVDSREIKSKNKSDEKISDKPAKKDRRLGKSNKEVKQGGI